MGMNRGFMRMRHKRQTHKKDNKKYRKLFNHLAVKEIQIE